MKSQNTTGDTATQSAVRKEGKVTAPAQVKGIMFAAS